MQNDNKTVHVGAGGITVCYADSNKHHFIPFNENYTMLEDIQLYGNSYKGKKYQQGWEQDEFTPYQNQLYRDCLFGINHYSTKDLKKIPLYEKQQIQERHENAQKVLNKWKQQLTIDKVDNFLLGLFPKSALVKQMVQKTNGYTDTRTVNKETFRDLGISKRQVAEKLVEANVLPLTFFTNQKAA